MQARLPELDQADRVGIDFGPVVSGTAALEHTMGNGRGCLAGLFHAGDLIDMHWRARLMRGRLIALNDGRSQTLDNARSAAALIRSHRAPRRGAEAPRPGASG